MTVDHLPSELHDDMRKAERLEWWTLGLMATVIVAMGLVAGSSQAMRTAWIEDLLSLVPAIVFLIAAKLEARPPTRRFPFGFARANSLAFLIAAVALGSVGVSLLLESTLPLIKAEHVTIPPMVLFGHTLWSGWAMVAVLVYSIVPPVILGRLKLPVAKRLQDKVLHTDAMMQKADWMTGLAGIAGVIGVGLGYWWADAGAAMLIALSILHDGIGALRRAVAELIDGTPRALERNEEAEDATALRHALAARYPGAEIRLREVGRFIHAQVRGGGTGDGATPEALWPGDASRRWRLAEVSFVPSPPDA